MISSESLDRLLADRTLRPLLPLLHAAWADGDLTAEEIHRMCEEFASVTDAEHGQLLRTWLDPNSPPSAVDLARLAAAVRAQTPPGGGPVGPVELGLRLTDSIDEVLVPGLERMGTTFGVSASVGLVTPGDESTLAAMPAPASSRFDTGELRRLVDGPHGAVKERVRAILSRPEFAYRYDLPIAEYRQVVLDWTQVLADEGVGGLATPLALGGGGDPGGFVAAFSTLAHHDLSLLTKFGVQFGLFAGTIMRLGSERHQEVLAGAIRMDPPGCFAMTETGHGSNVANLKTTATYDPGSQEFVLQTPTPMDRKDYIGNAARDGRMAVVFARLLVGSLDHGIHAFLVAIRDDQGRPVAGVTIGDDGPKAGLNGVDNGHISFAGLRVPAAALLDRFASIDEGGTYRSSITSPGRRFFTTLGTLVGGRVTVASAATSVAESALTIAVRYAHRRRQFSTSTEVEARLIDYRSHQRRLMPRLAATYAYHFACAQLTDEYVVLESEPGDSNEGRRIFESRAAGLKAFATWHALDSVQECREACGGQGYMAVNRLGPMRDDVDVFTTFEGDNTVLAQLLAKALLTDYGSSFDDLTPAGLVRYVLGRVAATVTGSVPVVGSVGGAFTDPDTCLTLLERRSQMLVEKLAERVKRRIDAGADAGAAFLDVQPHALSAARAATQLEVFRSIHSVTSVDEATADVIRQLAVLAALWWIESDLEWFLVVGLVTPNGAKTIRSTVTAMCEDVAAVSAALVDGFGIPDAVLGAPIAT